MTDTTERIIIARIRQLRRLRGETQSETAEGVGLSRCTYAKLESGARGLSATEMIRAADHFRVPVDDLATGGFTVRTIVT